MYLWHASMGKRQRQKRKEKLIMCHPKLKLIWKCWSFGMTNVSDLYVNIMDFTINGTFHLLWVPKNLFPALKLWLFSPFAPVTAGGNKKGLFFSSPSLSHVICKFWGRRFASLPGYLLHTNSSVTHCSPFSIFLILVLSKKKQKKIQRVSLKSMNKECYCGKKISLFC